MAEVFSKRLERPKHQMKIILKIVLCEGPRKGDKRAKGEEFTDWTIPDGHLPYCWLTPGRSRVTFSAYGINGFIKRGREGDLSMHTQRKDHVRTQ